MLASKVIEMLQASVMKHGDHPVVYEDAEFGFFNVSTSVLTEAPINSRSNFRYVEGEKPLDNKVLLIA